jgi:hypothetical protein
MQFSIYPAADSEMIDYIVTHAKLQYTVLPSGRRPTNRQIAIATISVVSRLYRQCAVPMLLGPTRRRSTTALLLLL